jgi:predicted RND superfamily exporter protein
MTTISTLIAQFLYKTRFVLLLLALLLTGFFAYHAVKIQFNFSADTIFLDDDEAYQFYDKTYLPAFAHQGHWCMVALEGKKLDHSVTALAQTLRKNPFVLQVIEPHSQPIFALTKQGFGRSPTINEQGELTPAAISYFNEHPLYQGSFISKDGHAMALTFMVDSGFNDQENQKRALDSIESDLLEFRVANPDIKLHLTGMPIIQHEMIKLLKNDQVRFVPLIAIFLVLLLVVMTKHPLGALFPLLIVFLAIIWTVGFLALVDHDINVVNNALIMLIMVIGIADAVHIYTRYVDESINARQNGKVAQKKDVVIATIAAMLLPCFLTSATTALGFLSSAFSGIEIIKLFGIDTAIGIMLCYLITFLIMPALLSLHKLPTHHAPPFMRKWPKTLTIDAILGLSISKSLRYAKLFSIIAIISLVASLFVARNITSNQNWVGELPPDNEASLALSFIEKNFSATMPFYIVLSGTKTRLSSRESALLISDIAAKIRKHPLHPTLRAPTDALNFLMLKNPQPLILSEIDDETFHEIMQGMEQFSREQKNMVGDMFFSADGQHLQILGFLANTSTTHAEEFRKFLNAIIEQKSLEGISIHATGPAIISSRALHDLTRNMASSIALALVLISVFVAIFFRSLRYMIIAVLPNILPIGLTIAAMYLFNVDVRLATVMIFSMALGLSIDACIHLLSRMDEERSKSSHSTNKIIFMRAIYRAFHGSGRPIIYTTVILLGGFSIMFFSEFMALRDFSIIASVTLLSALIADIVLLPALLLVTRKRS